MERLDAFMARANAAYYAGPDPLAGFATAPEISQVFGELLGAWVATVWAGIGRPAAVLAEAGPGRGTLMADALRVLRRAAPGLVQGGLVGRVHLIESSASLRAAQGRAVPGAVWHDRVEDLPAGPLLLLANEFLDALPVRQAVRRGDGWMERHVAGGAFVEVAGEAPPVEFDVEDGAVVEWSPVARDVVGWVARRVAREGGVALFVDYGPGRSGAGDSLQALRDGRAADPLVDAGAADLTAHVDFPALAGVARAAGAGVQGPVAQGDFLARLGLFERSRALAAGQAPARAGATMQAAQRLAEPHLMGRLFKAMAVCHPATPPLPGFAA